MMKLKKKHIAVISLILCIAAIVSLGSLAWFTDTDEITNTLEFVTDFEMDLYETDANGKIIRDQQGKSIGQTYENITPGETLLKNPTVINKSSSVGQYIRVTVTVDKIDKWVEVVPRGSELSDIFAGHDETKWTRYDRPAVDTAKKTVTYTYYLNDVLEPGEKVRLFTGITIPTSLTLEQAQAIGESHIIVKADAIQATNLGTVANTKAAFGVVENSN